MRKKIAFNNIPAKKKSSEKINKINKSNSKSYSVSKKKNLYPYNTNAIRILKSNIFPEQFNPIKKIYKTKMNI